jgi:hypothetical protein
MTTKQNQVQQLLNKFQQSGMNLDYANRLLKCFSDKPDPLKAAIDYICNLQSLDPPLQIGYNQFLAGLYQNNQVYILLKNQKL